MPEVDPNFKVTADCRCGCGLHGTPKRNGCIRLCKCPRCRGKRNRQSGLHKQRQARKALGLPSSKYSDANEETWGGAVRVEVKSGAQAQPVMTRFLASEAQSENERAIGDHRPFCAVFMPSGTRDGLAVVRLSVVHEFAAAIVETWGSA